MRQGLIVAVAGMFLLAGGMVGCGTSSTQEKEDLIVVDVSKDYPKKELILQDLFDVEYIPLETTDEFVTLGWLQAIGKDVMIVRNMWAVDGDIFIYDRNGKAIRHINRKGQGNEEYFSTSGIYLDDEKGEMFVGNRVGSNVLVYDLYGNFKRSFKFKDNKFANAGALYQPLYNFDREYFIGQDANSGRTFNFNDKSEDLEPRNLFLLISKQDGSVAKEIEIPFEKKVSQVLFDEKGIGMVNNPCIVPYGDRWLLTEPSCDTVYTYSSAEGLKPFIVRTPSIQSMSPEVFLFPGVVTDRYCFMQTVKKELNLAMMDTYYRLMRTDLVYDRETKEVSEYVLYNDDFTKEVPIANLVDEIFDLTVFNNDEIAFTWRINTPELVEAYQEGHLKGKLKEIAAGMHEEDNPVIMVAKYKR
ncbi:6-bladed beta-propeller [Parabacteroides sp.]